jgi:hypothetical protein
MKRFNRFTTLVLVALVSISVWSCEEKDSYLVSTIGFQEFQLPQDTFWNGSDGIGSITYNSVTFYNFFETNDWGGYWEGFAYSNITDIETPGYENQYSAYVKEGGTSYNIYSVAYVNDESASIFFPGEVNPLNIKITNSTWAYYSMLNGDLYAKKFEEGDWFKLTIIGYDLNDNEIASTEFYLADFRSPESYIIDTWTDVNLTSLKGVAKIVFHLSSSDNSEWGMNTPSYLCIDNLKIHFPL